MSTGDRLAAGVLLYSLCACTAQLETSSSRIVVGGTSPLVDMFDRVAADTGVPAALLATLSYVETRLRFVDSAEHGAVRVGLYGLAPDELARGARLAGVTDEAARAEHEASIRIAAALVRDAAPAAHTLDEHLSALAPPVAAELRGYLVRGIAARDAIGEVVVVAAHPELARADGPRAGLGTTTQALGAADYDAATWVAASSSNFGVSERGVEDITHVVIHTVQGSYGSCINWFKNPQAKVSAHYVVRSSDGDVTQMVREKDTAWHDKCFNTTTVGIEHEGYVADPELWYTDAMYLGSARLTAYLAHKYDVPIDHDRILGHGDAPDCSDHTDPGSGWDWDHYLELVETSGAPRLEATDVTVDAPASLASGDRATVTVTVTNRGNLAWDLDLTRLGTTDPQDRESALFVAGDWMSPSRATGADARVEPGDAGTFTFDIVAPAVREPTVIDEAFQLVQEGVGWFGPEVRVVLQVVPGEGTGTTDGGCSAGGGAGSGGTACAMLLLGAVARRRRRSRLARRGGRSGL